VTEAARIILASASPRRAELLRAAGIAHDIRASNVDETVSPGEEPEVYVKRLAEAKALAIASVSPGRTVLGADTVVVVDDQLLGKPRDAEDAARMLHLLSGRAHEVLTGVSVIHGSGRGSGTTDTRVDFTTVEFAKLGQEDIAWYVASGEPLDKAGAYAIQGLASRFVIRIDGSYSNVVGLPVALVYEMLEKRK
jgi:septum formation protein